MFLMPCMISALNIVKMKLKEQSELYLILRDLTPRTRQYNTSFKSYNNLVQVSIIASGCYCSGK